jgi:hypothetical protein
LSIGSGTCARAWNIGGCCRSNRCVRSRFCSRF